MSNDDLIKCLVRITPGEPLLLKDLSNMPARFRSQRLRHLAALGLLAEQGGLRHPEHIPAPASDTSGDDEKPATQSKAMKNFMRNGF